MLVEAGDMVPLDGEVIKEVVSAIRAAQPALGGKAVHTDIPADSPLVEFDAVLMERLLVDQLENAVKHGAPPFELRARAINAMFFMVFGVWGTCGISLFIK